MGKRNELILNIIINEHIKTGAPVGSSLLVDKYKLGISPATVRNEMAELEDEGYIIQPHTSAGRVPTEKAYSLYLENLNEKRLKNQEIEELDRVLVDSDEPSFKKAAKILARLSDNAVFWAFHKDNLYYTGISNLFSQPEFLHTNLLSDISTIIDCLDEIIDDIFDDVNLGPEVLLGSNNPFGNFCSTILTKYRIKDKTGLLGIIGPMRMDYEKNLALVSFVNNKLSKK